MVVPEKYTSRTCPKCGNVKNASPKGRIYSCNHGECDFAFDRDGVGAINIMKKNVSFGREYWLDVVGGLTPPIGVKYTPRLSLVKNKIIDSDHVEESIETYSRWVSEEPHDL